MNESWITLSDHGWVFSVLKPSEPPQNPPLIQLHGLTGDETSLRILSSNIKPTRWILALRGPMKADDGGYAWAMAKSRKQSDFSASISGVIQEWGSIRQLLGIQSETFDIMGFSQGAALASLLLIASPALIRRTALISGFLPHVDADEKPNLQGHPVLISHGTEDELVPYPEALHSAEVLRSYGADVTFCQSNTRHKIGAYCLSQLETFFD